MDMQAYWAIADRDIEIQNPVTDRKLGLLEAYCDVRDGLRVLDVGCGKAWLLRQWASHHAIHGTGIDVNPLFLEAARRHRPAKGRLDFIEAPATTFAPIPESYDVAVCLGASFALGGFVDAVDWMVRATRPGGSIVVGEVTLKQAPLTRGGLVLPHDATETIAIIERHGAEVSAIVSASDADFERYASHQRHATLAWAREHPTHPDHAEVLARSRADWHVYLTEVRPYLGWTIFVARREGG